MAVAWVSGASSGLGLYTAQALVKAGWQVVGGARGFQGEEAPGLLRLKLDVTSQESVDGFCARALERYGPPDALVNAAAVLIYGACEDYSMQELKDVMDVNYLGMARMVRAALPLMRGAGRGRIVNFSSVNGLMASPFQGAYTASKHAVEGYSEALQTETRAHGIRVMLVEPGDHRGGSRKYRGASAALSGSYAAARTRAVAVMARDEESGGDPMALARRVARAMGRKHMPFRLRVMKPLEIMALWLHDALPGGLFARLLAIYYGANRREEGAQGSPEKGQPGGAAAKEELS